MKITLNVNGIQFETDAAVSENLLSLMRRLGFFSVKHGCETGECGACTVLLDGKPVNSCVMLAAQAEGHHIQTVESLGEHPIKGWKRSEGLDPIQQAFVETGAIQCGYCTPAQVLAAKELLLRNPNPSEAEIREALSGVLCRCTGYLKPVQAVLRAAAVLRGETVEPTHGSDVRAGAIPAPTEWLSGEGEGQDWARKRRFSGSGVPGGEVMTGMRLMPRITVAPEAKSWSSVGKPEIKVDASSWFRESQHLLEILKYATCSCKSSSQPDWSCPYQAD